MIHRCHSSGARVAVIAIVCAIAVAMSGISQPAWAMRGCLGACCEPPLNAIHPPEPPGAPTTHCGGGDLAPCGLQDAPGADLSHLTAAMPQTVRPGSAVIQYHRAIHTAVRQRPLTAMLAFETDTHISAPPLYLSNAVLLR